MAKTLHDVIVIGGGPAGLTAALYTARAGLKTLLLEGTASVSQITTTDIVENYPGFPDGINGFDLVDSFKRQALAFSTKIVADDVLSLKEGKINGVNYWEVLTPSEQYAAISVIIATGTSWKRLGVPGEKEFLGRGVSFCATCDGPLYRNKGVLVVGGGNAAVQEALFLSRFVGSVTVAHRRERLRATNILQERAKSNDKISFIWNSVVREIRGEKTVREVLLENVVTQETSTINVNGIFIFIGLIPNTDIFHNIVALEPDNSIRVGKDMHTSTKGIFACGDCTSTPLRQVVTACGDGAIAAYSAQHFVEEIKGSAY